MILLFFLHYLDLNQPIFVKISTHAIILVYKEFMCIHRAEDTAMTTTSTKGYEKYGSTGIGLLDIVCTK